MNKFKKMAMQASAALLMALSVISFSGTATITAAKSDIGNQNTMAVAWYQTSAECKALYLQGYNIARRNLDQDLAQASAQPRAIILDIDETVLDNSPYQAYNALHDEQFPDHWNDWVNAAKAKPVPGAKDFLNYANQNGVQIYYVSDRSTGQLKATKKNLANQGLPQATDDHILLKGKNDKSKETRRQAIEKNNNVIMFFGDSLTDMNDPKSPSVKDRYQDVMENANQFGSKYIILPCPMYGGWEGALYGGNYNISNAQKTKDRKSHLTYFNPKTNKVENKTVTEP
ncbi:MAG: 5'-nucleotidase, lipoprotein e(P4) family [Limosilactobacillus oris]|jgi:5'-nucleotidase (lipoprotein e(P4) family)|uniref:5'-nucleotidase, lipoprotein e(P4) family n=1 Tax=Limosilactobacillus oris TaxID=1632 RepID=UPI00174C5B2F|nr:5'-nucleotidase, lipoprotein e(P4) family [Limosilactobacillus oris]MBF0600629.1 5'-nucleotidase, lipoprotein e(P4) family [Limosilactobacillus oris]MCH3911708.1 5'-nucleotidase, lipoprotein e(P4) family [Limosilactobacillus oris]MCH3938959.1 5'-nucleotidase, lipoprotein e(P4) family [Limosilactobacillus oris]MCI1979787.1 5'-nucleotidase, lipoprotein e(P4) family [Limosilactobacillus oris]MCI2042462.1 5'-nucleotidase, lipoprotein e(P4) family [Limosilactobacillus oris]